MDNTFSLIKTVTVGSGGSSSIDFASIPSTFTDLLLKISIRSAATTWDASRLSINGSASNFVLRYVQAYGGSNIQAGAGSSTFIGYVNAADSTSNVFTNIEVLLTNYAGNTNYKTFMSNGAAETNSSSLGYITYTGNLWSVSTAISSLSIYNSSGSNLVQYSSASLYGITKF